MFTNEALKRLRSYPPAPSKSRYRRTKNLKKGWKKQFARGGNIGVDIFNEVGYAGLLQGRRFSGEIRQFPIRQRQGWVSLTDINQDLWPIYERRIARALGIRRHRVRNVRV